MKKIFLAISLGTVSFLVLPEKVLAVCPVCTVAVCAGIGLSRWLGVDDLISGVWMGGLIISLSLWLLDWLKRKKINFKFRSVTLFSLFYILTIVPLYLTGIMGHPYNKFWGIDRLLFGIISGSLAFLLGNSLNVFLKKKNQGKVYFPFQKVVIPILFLIILTLIFYKTC